MTKWEIAGALALAAVAFIWWQNRVSLVVDQIDTGTVTTDTNQSSAGNP